MTVSDSDGASGSDTLVVAVANVAPTVTLAGSASANEGTSHTYSFTVSDPGADDFVLGTTECGANGVQVGGDTFNSTTGAGSFVCSFPDGPASSTVSVTVSDSDGASDSDSITVAIANVAPDRDPDRLGHGERGHQPHVQLHRQRPGQRHLRPWRH